MTIAAEAIKIKYNCNGVLVNFDFTYKIFDEDDIKVVVTDSLGIETVLAITTDYTVAGDNNAFESGGTVTTVKEVSGVMENYAYPTGSTITIILNLTLEQTTDLIYGGSYKATAIEQMADRLTKIVQQLSEKLDRSLKFKIDSSLDVEVEDPTTGYYLYSPDGLTVAWVENVSTGTATITAFAKTLLDDATASAWLTTLGFTTFIKTLVDDANSKTALKTLLSLLHSTTAKTANYSITATDRGKLVNVNATTGNLVITLLAAATAGDGFSIAVKKTDASGNYVTIDPAGAELIDGGAEHILYKQNDVALIVCDGTGWKMVSIGIVGLTDNRLLIGAGGSSIDPMDAMTDGQIVVGQTGAAPLPKTISGSATIDTDGVLTIGDDVVTLAMSQHGSVALPFYMPIEDAAFDSSGFGDTNFHVVQTFRVYIPTDATTIRMAARIKHANHTLITSVKFTVSSDSSIGTRSEDTYAWVTTMTLDVSALSGWYDLEVQLKSNDAAQAAYLQGFSFIWE